MKYKSLTGEINIIKLKPIKSLTVKGIRIKDIIDYSLEELKRSNSSIIRKDG